MFKKKYTCINKFNLHFAQEILLCVFIAASILIVYLQVANHEFTNYDDDKYVSENRLIQKSLSIETIVKVLTIETAGNWHPVTMLSHMLDYHMYGMEPGCHFLTNVLFHTLNTVLLFFLLKNTTGYLWRSAFVAILFALHPLHVESVAWISERKDVLSTFFWLLTIRSYTHYSRYSVLKRYIIVMLFLILGLMTKPMLVTLPFVLILFDFWPLKRHETEGFTCSRIFYEKIPLFILIVASSIITMIYQQKGGAVKTIASYPFYIRIENAIVSYIAYIGKILWPFRLAAYYPHTGEPPFLQIVVSLAILFFIILLSLYYSKKKPWFIFGWFLYLGTLVPVIGFVQVGSQALADRYTYIPSIGIFIMLVWTIADFFSKYRYKKAGATIATVSIISILIILSWLQTSYWQNSITLFKHALNVTANNHIAHNNLGLALKKSGKTKKAISHYKKSIDIKPGYVIAHNNLGVALSETGNIEEAIKHYATAIKIMPEFINPHINLASIFLDTGKPEKAVDECRKALKVSSEKPELFIILGDALSALEKTDRAAEQYKKAISIDPYSTIAHNRFGAFLFKNNKIDRALSHFKKALTIEPGNKNFQANYTTALNTLALMHASKNDFNKAVFYFKKILLIKPDKKDVYYNLACMYARQDNIKESIKWFTKAINRGYSNWDLIKTDQDLESIRKNPDYLKLLHGKPDQQANR